MRLPWREILVLDQYLAERLGLFMAWSQSGPWLFNRGAKKVILLGFEVGDVVVFIPEAKIVVLFVSLPYFSSWVLGRVLIFNPGQTSIFGVFRQNLGPVPTVLGRLFDAVVV